MHQTRHRALLGLTQGIVCLALAAQTFHNRGHHGAAQGLIRIIRVKQAHIIWGDGQGQRMTAVLKGCFFRVGEVQNVRELFVAADAMRHLPMPIVPELGADSGKIFFPKGQTLGRSRGFTM